MEEESKVLKILKAIDKGITTLFVGIGTFLLGLFSGLLKGK